MGSGRRKLLLLDVLFLAEQKATVDLYARCRRHEILDLPTGRARQMIGTGQEVTDMADAQFLRLGEGHVGRGVHHRVRHTEGVLGETLETLTSSFN